MPLSSLPSNNAKGCPSLPHLEKALAEMLAPNLPARNTGDEHADVHVCRLRSKRKNDFQKIEIRTLTIRTNPDEDSLCRAQEAFENVNFH